MLLSKKIEQIRIESSVSALKALKQMDKTRKRLLLVFRKDLFLGLLSIGDIQRAIIKGISLDTQIVDILKRKPKIGYVNTPIEEIKREMLQFRMEFMPIIDQNGCICNVYFWEDLFVKTELPPNKQFNLPLVIMAGGFGSRMKPLTNVLPKPLIPIGDKTILEDIFERFSNHGCNTFYVSINYKADLIRYYIQNQKLPYKIEYFEEDEPMGTAGSLSLLKGKINTTFFVSNCDILIDQDYSEILDYHYSNKNDITVVAALKHFPIAYGTIETGANGRLLKLVEKPELTFKINSGMYILEPHLLDEIPENQFLHITNLIEKILERKGNVGVFPVSEKSWKDIGDWHEYMNNIF